MSRRPAAAQDAPRLRVKVWVERGGEVLISGYRAELLAAVEATGSVAGAAAALRLPRRTAWKKLEEMERALGVALLESTSGGAGGGGSRLTPAAAEALAAFRRLEAPLARGVEARFAGEQPRFAPRASAVRKPS